MATGQFSTLSILNEIWQFNSEEHYIEIISKFVKAALFPSVVHDPTSWATAISLK